MGYSLLVQRGSQKRGPPLLGRGTYLKEKALGSTPKNWSRKQTGIKAPTGKLTLELGPGTVTKVCGSHTVATSPTPHPSSSPRCFPAVMRAVKGHSGSQDGDSQDGQNLRCHRPPPPSSKGPDDQNVPQHGHYLPHGVPFSENTFQSQPPLFVGLSTRPNLAFLSGTISRSF